MRQIVVEAETPDDPRSLFRLRVDQTLIAEGLTSAQAQIAVGEILEEITTMEQPKFPDPRPYIYISTSRLPASTLSGGWFWHGVSSASRCFGESTAPW